MSDTIKLGGKTPLFQNLQSRLSTFEGARDVYAEVIARYGEAEINESNARTMAYLLSGLLSYFKHEADMRIEERLEAIEQALEARR